MRVSEDTWVWFEFSGSPEALELLQAELDGSGPTGFEERTTPEGALLRGYWPASGIARAEVEAATAASGARVVASGTQPREDWLAEWKKAFKPLKVSRRLWVGPPWDPPRPGPGEKAIILDQKRAFGTGHHATTRLCLEWIDDTVRDGASFLDVGCGSAILAIAAVLLGAREATAIDIDPDVIDEARENTRVHGLAERVHVACGDFADLNVAPADLVVANVLAAQLLPLLPRLAAATAGDILLAGLERRERDEVRPAVARAGFDLVGERESEGWCALHCRPQPRSR